MGEMRNSHNIFVRQPKEKKPLEDPGVEERIIFE
jgi:hypothetical protein